jgi:hypothetical protein
VHTSLYSVASTGAKLVEPVADRLHAKKNKARVFPKTLGLLI